MVHARLGIAEENSGKLVSLVRRKARELAEEKNVSVLGRIPFDPIFIKSMIQGQTIFEYSMESEAGQAVKQIWEKSSKTLGI